VFLYFTNNYHDDDIKRIAVSQNVVEIVVALVGALYAGTLAEPSLEVEAIGDSIKTWFPTSLVPATNE
jgi:hypothetical protein